MTSPVSILTLTAPSVTTLATCDQSTWTSPEWAVVILILPPARETTFPERRSPFFSVTTSSAREGSARRDMTTAAMRDRMFDPEWGGARETRGQIRGESGEGVTVWKRQWKMRTEIRKKRSGAMLKEFREFAMKGNVMDMAVGLIIGAG